MADSKQNKEFRILGHEGSTLLDFRLNTNQFDIGVNAPGLLFTGLEVRTSLHLQDGCDYAALRKLVKGFTVEAYCGHTPPEKVEIGVIGSNISPYVSIDLGPSSMYMSRLRFDTTGGDTFAELCDRALNPLNLKNYLVALVPIINNEINHGDHDISSHDHNLSMVLGEEVSPFVQRKRKYRIEYVLNRERSEI